MDRAVFLKRIRRQKDVLARNLLNFPFDFDNAYWTKAFVTITANNTTAPDGTLTADKVSEDASNNQHIIFNNFNSPLIVLGANYRLSAYFKYGSRQWIQFLGSGNSFGLNVWSNFDMQNLVFGSQGVETISRGFEVLGSGWIKIWLVAKAVFGGSNFPLTAISFIENDLSGRAPVFIGNTANNIFIWGAKLERIL
jgi:hypothetical protein